MINKCYFYLISYDFSIMFSTFYVTNYFYFDFFPAFSLCAQFFFAQ